MLKGQSKVLENSKATVFRNNKSSIINFLENEVLVTMTEK